MAPREDRKLAQPTVASVRVPASAEEPSAAPPAAPEPSSASGEPASEGAAHSVAATLVAVEGDLQGESFTLVRGENHLGRGRDCAPVLNSRWISRSHARVFCEQGRVLLRATEGKEVFVNENLIAEEPLQDGDRVRMGATVFMLRMVTGSGERGSSAIPVISNRTGNVPVQPAAPDAPPAPVARASDASEEAAALAPKRARPWWKFWEKPVPTLVFTRGPRAGERFDLDKPRVRIGGLNDNDIVIQGHDASRNHAELRIRDGRAHIWDLRSVNGTWVNERRIENVELKFGDVIRIGSEELRFED